jgi:tripartite-type tricarboxylate transporter receptor subunit TctC
MRLIPVRRQLIRSLPAAALAAVAPISRAQESYPSRPVRLVVAYPPGGPVDTLARALAQPLGDDLGQPVVVENRPGAGGVIGSDHVAKSQPDGHVLLFGSTPLTIQESLLKKLPYSILKDFTAISNMAEGPQALVVGNDVPVNSVRELIDYARAQKGKLNFASPSTGGSNHLAAEMFKTMGKFEATHIPYNGNAPAEIDLIAGRVAFMFGAFSSSMAQAERGRLKVLGVSARKRMATAPNVPTISEVLPEFEVMSWYGVLGPARMPPAVTQRVNAGIGKVLALPEMRKRLLTMDLEPAPGSASHFDEYLRRNAALWATVIRDGNVRVD